MKSLFCRKISLQLISIHRAVLYGFSALIIAVFHMITRFPEPLATLQELGEMGVEIFTLLTGFGLYHSMQNDPRPAAFYKKRFLRVFPAAFLVAVLYFGLRPGRLWLLMCKALLFPLWLGIDTLWFAAFILTMYLFYPLIFNLQKRNEKWLWGLLALSSAGVFWAASMDNSWLDVTLCPICRIPVFLLGCIAAPRILRGDEISAWHIPAALGMGILFMGIASRVNTAYYFFRTIGFVFLAEFCILTLSLIAECFTRGTVRRLIYRQFAFWGSISLEIYLVFTRLRYSLMQLPAYQNGEITLLKVELVTFLLTPVVSALLAQTCTFLARRITQTPVPEPLKGAE